MDAADVAASEGVMIAFLPTTSDWCKQDLPHMTLVYAGTTSSLNPGAFNDLAKDAASLAMMNSRFGLRVRDIAVFGEAPDLVNVLRFQPSPELLAMRRFVDHWNASQHAFNPHATIGPVSLATPSPLDMPTMVWFDRIMVGWGDDSITCWLK